MIYLDWAASAPPEPEALEAFREAATAHFANPSSPHGAGRKAAEALEGARARIAALLGGGGQVVFTSGATESNTSFLLTQLSRQRKADVRGRAVRIVTSGIEHASVHEQARLLEGMGLAAAVVPPGPDGRLDPARVAEALDEDTALVSVMLVNNETGAVQPLREIVQAVRDFSARTGRRILVHTDAAQGFCKVPFTPAGLGVDAVSLSAHKIGGPRGVGALWLAEGAAPGFLAAGGGQEGGRRPGTENLPGILGMTAAAEKRHAGMAAERERAAALSSALIEGLSRIPEARLFPEARRAGTQAGAYSPFIVSFGFPPLPGEVVVRMADARGIMIATGSACSSRKKSRSRVLESMGIRADVALSALRVSTGPASRLQDIESLLAFLAEEVLPVRGLSTKGTR
jgi:cysteine desulfurase